MTNGQRVDPYGFVRLVGTPQRLPATPHHRFEGHSGRLSCRLAAKTPLFIYNPQFARLGGTGPGHEVARFPIRWGVATIPGSSLKGVIRSVAEAVEASCFTLFSGDYHGSGPSGGLTLHVGLPYGFEQCTDRKRLCPTCRIFGSLGNGGDMVHLGKVSISDATAPQADYQYADEITLDVLSKPKPEARPKTYTIEEDGRRLVRGRKFYRHRLDGVLQRPANKQDRQNKTVRPLGPGSTFTFEVEYNDLRDAELRLLLYALVLEPGLWHKIGMGKPLGLGSVQVQIEAWERIDREARYKELGAGIAPPLEGEELAAELDEWLRHYRQSKAANLEDLRALWRYDHNYDVRYQEPEPDW